VSLLISDVLAVPKSLLGILDAPSTPYWSDAELISYCNNFIFDVCGRRRDLYTIRVFVSLEPGTDQTLPIGGIQFLDAHFTGTGKPVFVKKMEDGKHTFFKNLASQTPVTDIKIVCADVRDRTRYHVFPPSDGTSGSTLELFYGAVPAAVTAVGNAYPLDPDTVGAANNFIIALAYDKNGEHRDTVKSAEYMRRYEAWITANLQNQLAEQAKED
jgi:hypothetical protein